MRALLSFAAAAAFGVVATMPATAATLDDVKARGTLSCGVNAALPGFAAEKDGRWSGFDVDFCRAVAAAALGDAEKVTFVPVGLSDRFTALKEGKIDLLARNSTWTMGREMEYGITFVGVTYYDGQGFMLPRAANILSSLELTGRTVCVLDGTTTRATLADYFKANNMTYDEVVTASTAESLAKYLDGTCNTMTSDMSQLYGVRTEIPDGAEHVILADAISKEPLGPAVRADDPQWATLVKWVHFALLDAEELGVGKATIEVALQSQKPEVRRLLGLEGGLGEALGVGNDWAANALGQVGNYGEIFERNLGAESELGIPRGMNQLWSRGGIQYAPPVR